MPRSRNEPGQRFCPFWHLNAWIDVPVGGTQGYCATVALGRKAPPYGCSNPDQVTTKTGVSLRSEWGIPVSQPQAPKPKKGKSLMASALESGLDSLNDPAVLVQLTPPVSPPLTPEEASPQPIPLPQADRELALELLDPSSDQARTYFDPIELEELAQSIREKGVLQPLLVRPRDGRFQILAGERRWRAAKLAGLERVPVYIREMDDAASEEISLIENLHRADLNRVEKLEKILHLIGNRYDRTRDWAIAALRQAWAIKQGRRPTQPVASESELETLRTYLVRLGIGLSNLVVSSLPCLAWPPMVYRAVASGRVGMRFAELIVKQAEDRHAALLEVAERLDLEAFSLMLMGETKSKSPAEPSVDLALVDGLKKRFGVGVKVSSRQGQTSITLTAKNDQEWERLLNALKL
jgi:ParB family transcriptional regulator, chromosome partitioning protein